MKDPIWFGVRHLSPAGAWHLRQLLDEVQPKLVLVEGPSDLSGRIPDLVRPETVPPVAILSYTKTAPVHSILYPLAEYSPEYQAMLWCRQHGVPCRFMDLPSEVTLALGEQEAEAGEGPGEGPGDTPAPGAAGAAGKSEAGSEAEQKDTWDPWAALDRQAGEDGRDTFWERVLEHTDAPGSYRAGALRYGAEIRALTQDQDPDQKSNLLREAYMRRTIEDAMAQGCAPEEIVAVTGAYHVEGLKAAVPLTDKEIAALPRTPANSTLMPYSYYRLSSRSGYGAGNRAPAYYALIWKGFLQGDLLYHARTYLTQIARYQRERGSAVSPAEVIEAERLAEALAQMRGSSIPVLRDLRDAAVTCLGGGSFAAISLGTADTEIGTAIGSLPEGVSQTSIQLDFNRMLKELKLERYRTVAAQDLNLDLRENRSVKSEAAAYLDLHRSFFLHRLAVLHIPFAVPVPRSQGNATWAESWKLQWTPEAELELVEAALKGDTVEQAAAFHLAELAAQAAGAPGAAPSPAPAPAASAPASGISGLPGQPTGGMAALAEVLEQAFACGLPEAVHSTTKALQSMAAEAAALEDLAATAHRLSGILEYGDLRKLDSEPLKPLLQQIWLRCCLILPGECARDAAGAVPVQRAMEQLNAVSLAQTFLDSTLWQTALEEICRRDDLNARLSGFAAALLLERSWMDGTALKLEVSRRLSPGVPADQGAGWFEGLAQRNRYALIARLSLWESLSQYLDGLDDEEFKRALVFLRRAFADFSSGEKDAVAENLGEIWGLNPTAVSAAVNGTLDQEAQDLLSGLGDFGFDDI